MYLLIATALSYHWVYNLQSNTPSHFTRLPRAVWTYASRCDMSQDSISTQDFIREIDESIIAHDKLLEFSKQDNLILPDNMNQAPSTSKHLFAQGTTIPNPGFQQAVNTPLPPSPTMQQSWTPEETIILQEHLIFHTKMIEATNAAVVSGPQKLPKPPKRKLENLFKEKSGKAKKSKKEMTMEELHNYLCANRVDINKVIKREIFDVNNILSVEDAVKRLQQGYKHLQREHAQSMLFNIRFGQLLRICKDWHGTEKEAGRMMQTWEEWLKSVINISASHSRRLQQLAHLLYPFPMFFNVGLSQNEIFGMKKQIEQMLKLENYRQYWSQQCIPPLTTQLQQSQE